MLHRIVAKSLLLSLVGGMFLSWTPGYDSSQPSDNLSVQGVRPGVSDAPSSPQRPGNRGTGQEEMAQANDPQTPYPIGGNYRMGNWDYKENWRYNRDAYYRGETQAQAYREDHPYGPEGIGYDGDYNYARNLKRYQQLDQQNPSDQNYYNPYHVQPYQGNYGQGSHNDAYGNPNNYYNNSNQYYDQYGNRRQ